MIKGLYFKLNLDNERDKRIYNFFKTYPKKIRRDKVEMLDILIRYWNLGVDNKDEHS